MTLTAIAVVLFLANCIAINDAAALLPVTGLFLALAGTRWWWTSRSGQAGEQASPLTLVVDNGRPPKRSRPPVTGKKDAAAPKPGDNATPADDGLHVVRPSGPTERTTAQTTRVATIRKVRGPKAPKPRLTTRPATPKGREAAIRSFLESGPAPDDDGPPLQ